MEKKQKLIDIFVAKDGREFFREIDCVMHEEGLVHAKLASDQQLRNQQTERENAIRVQKARDEWDALSEAEQADIRAERRVKMIQAMEFGVEQGWWPSFNDKLDPQPWPKIIKISELNSNETTMAHIVAKIGVFESISEARKNGWNKPVQKGEFWFKKKTVHLIVVD